ncbi:MtnX-like HAD-IB family phosphatase [candidate division KSB1 bacterium]
MPAVKVFCDFDGTISSIDIGNYIFTHYAKERNFDLIKLWKENKMSSRKLMIEECKIVNFTLDEVLKLIRDLEIDSTFLEFYRILIKNNIPVTILSDGLDFYIQYFLKKYNIEEIPFRANTAEFTGDGTVIPDFPYFEQGCGKCGNCKGGHLKKEEKGSFVVYIGDGYSDRCAAPHADIIFAKKDFAKYCKEQKIPFILFENFDDVLSVLIEKNIIQK